MTDEKLFRLAKQDAVALTTLYDRYAEIIYRYVRFRIPKQEDAEDIVSATFEKLLAQDSSLRFTQSFSAWIHTVAKRKIIDYWRTRKFDLPITDIDLPHHEQLDRKLDNQAQLAEVLAKLSEVEKAMLILHVLDGLTYTEIAATYKLSTDAVKKRFERLKAKCQMYDPR